LSNTDAVTLPHPVFTLPQDPAARQNTPHTIGGRQHMPKLRHIALATDDPEKTAAFYREAFDFKEVGRVGDPDKPDEGLAWGIYLSDGTLNLAVLNFKNVDQLGKGLDYVGIHHFGVLCEDLDGTIDKLDEMRAPCILKQDENTPDNFYETKFVGPDGVVFDVSEHAWIGAATAEEKEIDLDALLAAE
jgi:catechol 2,3-dioxygenase-like lactoylglutathione lyase family enzyme